MPENISRRQLIATGAAGTAGALGLGACSETKLGARQDSSEPQAVAARGQDPGQPPGGIMAYKKVKPFLYERYSQQPPTDSAYQTLYAWVREQLEEHWEWGKADYPPPGNIDPVVASFFNAVEYELEYMIKSALVWLQVVETDKPIVVLQGRDREIINGPIPPPPPPPPPDDNMQTREVQIRTI